MSVTLPAPAATGAETGAPTGLPSVVSICAVTTPAPATCLEVHVHAKGAVVSRVDRHALDELRRVGLEVHGAVDAAEDPEVGVALGAR